MLRHRCFKSTWLEQIFFFFRNPDQDEINALEDKAKIVNTRVDNLYIQIDYHNTLIVAKKRRLNMELQQKKIVKERLHYLKVHTKLTK